MIGTEIQLRNRLGRSQRHRQLQLCVPLVTLKGASYRLRDRGVDTLPSIKAEQESLD